MPRTANRLLLPMILIAGTLAAPAALADNFHGKFTVVQVTSTGTRFYASAEKLSLFAPNADYRDIMMATFFRKAATDIAYTRIPCPAGITGTCGNVQYASVDVTAVP